MKKLLVAVIIVCSSVTAFASIKEEKATNAKFKVTTNLTAKKAQLTFFPSGKGKVLVSILDANGKTIFQEQVKMTEGFVRPYDLSELKGADYTMVVTEDGNEFSEKINLSAPKSTPELSSFQANAQIVEGGKVALKVLQNEVNTVFVAIKDYQGNVFYSAAISNEASFVQQFDITKIKSDIYFEVKTSNGSKTIEL